ncbi:hypothetical protein BDQ17DRAFT_1323959 [Cyathus striatus]|nr:hypothetical protein BDQ17DRAFT_1323959 [Cyathus striatus]
MSMDSDGRLASRCCNLDDRGKVSDGAQAAKRNNMLCHVRYVKKRIAFNLISIRTSKFKADELKVEKSPEPISALQFAPERNKKSMIVKLSFVEGVLYPIANKEMVKAIDDSLEQDRAYNFKTKYNVIAR